MKRNKGITLIALVITIVVLIILAGVAINLTLGENGVFRKAKYAKEQYNNGVKSEEEQLNEMYAFMNGNDLPENTPENPQQEGTVVQLPEKWAATAARNVSVADGKEITDVQKVSTVYAVSVGSGNSVPIPYGFYYVGGTIDSGVVISDNAEDKDTYKGQADVPSGIELKEDGTINYALKGNLFVWVPCSVENYKKYDWGTGYRNNVYSPDVTAAEKTQIQKYGGFYVGRYEAGLATTVAETTTTQQHTGSNQVYNKDGVPQSKAGIVPWDFVDYTHSKANSESMYNTNSVNSGLITGTMWDTMISWMAGASNSAELTSGSNWGNYYITTPTYNGRTAYASIRSGSWYQDKFTDKFTKNGTKPAGGTSAGTLWTTGASEQAKKKNLYDVAGNLWEWTEETAVATTSNGVLASHRVIRGGSFIYAYATYPACYRSYGTVTLTSLHFGFRVALYIK